MKKLTPYAVMLTSILGLAASQVAITAEKTGIVSIDLPAETARLKPGTGMETAGSYCMICHSVDYIYMQPPLTKKQWTAEVRKMQKVYGAPIPDKDIETIVNYLVTQNGKK